MPRIVSDEETNAGRAGPQEPEPQPDEPLGAEYDEAELESQEARSDFGEVPMESQAWMASVKRINNLIDDARIRIGKIEKQQEAQPTEYELSANDRIPTSSVIHEGFTRADKWEGVTRQCKITLESIQQELNTLDRELRSQHRMAVARTGRRAA